MQFQTPLVKKIFFFLDFPCGDSFTNSSGMIVVVRDNGNYMGECPKFSCLTVWNKKKVRIGNYV